MTSYVSLISLCVCVLVVLKPTSASKTKTPSSQYNYAFLAGRPGIPGMHGKPGAPGRDGRDGREGIQGKRGPRGFSGSPGDKGATGSRGMSGNTGQAGAQGARGAKGDRGLKGEKGESGSKGLSSYSNWKECSWNKLNDGKDNGKIKDCVFQKKYSDSVLHVYWNGDFRIHGCNSCCKRWYFKFNGAECKSPRPIDAILYMLSGKSQNIHRIRHVEGHCDKIHKGQVRVGFWVGNCPGYGNADAYTGYLSTSRLFIEEVPRPQS